MNTKTANKPKMRAPRVCKEPTIWHGVSLKPGEIFGVDRNGPYITRPIMYNNCMAFRRPYKYGDLVVWETRRASAKTSEHIEIIKQRFTLSLPPLATQAGQILCRVKMEKRENTARSLWHDEQTSVIRKNHFRFKSRIHGNCKEYRDATLLTYGDTAEVNGRFVPVTDKIGFYLDGGMIH